MSKRFHIVFIALAIATVGMLVMQISPRHEPSWRGKKLSAWIHDFSGVNPTLEAATMEAVRAMGTNVIPFVRAELRRRDTPWKLKLIDFARKQNLINLPLRTAAELHQEACMIYSFTEASVKGPLVGDWIKFVDTGGPNELRTALMSHGGRGERSLGAEAIPALMQGLESNNEQVRLLAVVWLKCIPAPAERLVPALVRMLSDTNLEVRGSAALSLGNLRQQPTTTIPSLLRGLNDPQAIMRYKCVRALGFFTNEAPSIVPLVQKALGDPDRIVRSEAERVLKQLLPDESTTASIHDRQ